MAPTSVLQRAKQGDPEAIEILMNATLQPREVTAKVMLIAGCLHVSFSATRALNQTTLVSFTRNGLANLKPDSIQWVKVYGLQVGHALPTWTTEFSASQLEDDAAADEIAPETATIAAVPKRWSERLLGIMLLQSLSQLQTGSWRLPNIDASKCLMAVSLVAFLSGGAIGVIASVSRSEKAMIQSATEQRNQQQQEARHYLTQMNQAQQAFYQKNQRFASSLEELERSASIISQSYHYTYKLTIRDQTQSQLTATPKAKGLTSFTAAVFARPANAASGATIATICASKHSSKIPPAPQLVGNTAQCPATSSVAL